MKDVNKVAWNSEFLAQRGDESKSKRLQVFKIFMHNDQLGRKIHTM